MTKATNTHLLNKGVAKVHNGDKIYESIKDRDKGKRLVRVNSNTWVYTDKATDEQAIEAYNRRYGIITSQ